ncbi:MAG: hypothetical protein HFH72_16885 [Lachnospiraceae bacterium]|nr:hypothetical protein [Lachnospiraceae bacterium]
MSKKPIKFIIPRIHLLNDYYYIQWIGYEYYIKRENINNYFSKCRLKILEVILLFLILIIGKSFPPKNLEDILRLFLLVVISGIQSGVAIADYINTDTK